MRQMNGGLMDAWIDRRVWVEDGWDEMHTCVFSRWKAMVKKVTSWSGNIEDSCVGGLYLCVIF